jgi:hypothetical protein
MMFRWLVTGFAFLFSFLASLPYEGNPGEGPHSPPMPVVTGDSLVSFVSDTQSRIFLEELYLRANNNDSAREMIYSALLADRPNAIFHLGDMIALGLYAPTWQSTDRFLARAAAAGIPVFPTLGNHEIMISSWYGLYQFYDRFPWYKKTGYAVRAGNLAVVLLNSNFASLKPDERKRQRSFLDSTLAAFELDSTVRAVILCCHHPPYTNSTIVSPSGEVREDFVPLYLRYSKCTLFLSGHCHSFEHFHEGGKDFLVIGGGGGLQQPLLTGSERRWEDLFPDQSMTRMFHYVRCRITGHGLEMDVRMIKKDFSGFEGVYALSIPWR